MNWMFGILPTLDPAWIGWGAVSVAAVAVFVNQVIKAKRNVVGVPPVGELLGQVIALEKRIAHQESETLEAERRRKALYERIEDTRKEIMTAIEALRKENKADTEAVHERVNDVLKGVARLEGRISRD